MKDFQIMRYLKKYYVMIIAFSLLAGAVFFWFVKNRMQSYTAAAVIEYTNSEASEGRTPDDKLIDPNEMIGSNIIIQVMENLGISESASMDNIRKNITITPIIPEEEVMMQEAQIEQGNEYTIYPTKYLVTFSADVSFGKQYTRRVLDELLDVYTAYYGEEHVNRSGGANDISDIYEKNYDYIEMIDVISNSLLDTRESLSVKINADEDFRSFKTGYSFSDLYEEFELLRSTEVPKIAAEILTAQITKDRDVLLAKYRNTNNDLSIENVASSEEVEKIKGIITAYVALMASSENTDVESDYILDQVYDNYRLNAQGDPINITDQTTEYDHLLRGYVENRNQYEDNLIDIAYHQYILSVYETAPAASSDALQAKAEAQISSLVEKVNTLYQIYNLTNDEYNEYLGADNFVVLTTVGVSESIPTLRYTLLFVVAFCVLCCLAAVVLGRFGDILDYHVYTNKVDGLPNRAKCDRYIAAKAAGTLPSDHTCFAFKVTNLRSVNEELGRHQGDQMLKLFADVLRNVFGADEKCFLANNGAGQYLVFADDMTEAQADAAVKHLEVLVKHCCENEQFDIQYVSGIANAQKEECFTLRKLLSVAMQRMNESKQSVQA